MNYLGAWGPKASQHINTLISRGPWGSGGRMPPESDFINLRGAWAPGSHGVRSPPWKITEFIRWGLGDLGPEPPRTNHEFAGGLCARAAFGGPSHDPAARIPEFMLSEHNTPKCKHIELNRVTEPWSLMFEISEACTDLLRFASISHPILLCFCPYLGSFSDLQ